MCLNFNFFSVSSLLLPPREIFSSLQQAVTVVYSSERERGIHAGTTPIIRMTESIANYCKCLKDGDVDDTVEIVLCGNTQTDKESVIELASLIKLRATQTIDLIWRDINSEEDFHTLTSYLVGSSSIKSFTIDGAFFGDNEIRHLIPVLSSNGSTTKLVITNTNLTVEGIRSLHPFISGCLALSIFKMSIHQWTDGIAQELTEALLLRESDLDVWNLPEGFLHPQ